MWVQSMKQLLSKMRRGFGLAHTVWGLLGLVASLLLIMDGGGGHPPAIVLLPFVLGIWLAGHLNLWGASWMLAKWRCMRQKKGGSASDR